MPRSTKVWRRGAEQKRQPAMLRGPPAYARVHTARGQQVLEVVDPLEPRPLAVLEDETDATIDGIELFGAPTGGPLRLELGQEPVDLLEIRPIAARVRTAARRVRDAGARNDVLDDRGEVADPVILGGLAHVERLVVDRVARRRQDGEKRARDVLGVHDRPPRGSVAADVQAPGRP